MRAEPVWVTVSAALTSPAAWPAWARMAASAYGIALLRHERARARVPVGQLDQAELAAGVDLEVLRELREVRGRDRERREQLGVDVPLPGRVLGVLHEPVAAEQLGQQARDRAASASRRCRRRRRRCARARGARAAGARRRAAPGRRRPAAGARPSSAGPPAGRCSRPRARRAARAPARASAAAPSASALASSAAPRREARAQRHAEGLAARAGPRSASRRRRAPMRRTSSASRELKASPSAACQGNSADGDGVQLEQAAEQRPRRLRAAARRPRRAPRRARCRRARGRGRAAARRAARARRRPPRARRPGRQRAVRPRRDSRRQPCAASLRWPPPRIGEGGILPRMHSSYALSSDDFAVERDGEAGPLSDLWPGGYQPGDRLGVVLNQPMDPCGCSNLICATNTLFYDVLRDTQGDRRLLPLRRHVPDRRRLRARRLQPARRLAAAQVRRRAAADRGGASSRPSTTAASRCSCCPRRACAAVARSCSRPGMRCWRRFVASSPTRRARGRARGGDVGPARQQDRRELRRAGDLLDARHRRRRAGAPAPPAPRDRPRAAAQLRGVQDAPERRRRARAAGRDRGAAARPPGGLAPLGADDHPAARGADGRRSTRPSAPLDAATALSAPPPESRRSRPTTRTPAPTSCPPDTLRHTPFDAIQRRMGGQFAEWEGWDWISDFGDAGRRAPRRARDGRPVGRVAAAEVAVPRSRRAGRRRLLLHERHGGLAGRPGALRRVLRRARPHARRRHRLQHRRQRARHPRRDGALDRRRPLPQASRPSRASRSRSSSAPTSCRTCSCRARARASCWRRSRTPTSARCATSASSRASRSAACPAA